MAETKVRLGRCLFGMGDGSHCPIADMIGRCVSLEGMLEWWPKSDTLVGRGDDNRKERGNEVRDAMTWGMVADQRGSEEEGRVGDRGMVYHYDGCNSEEVGALHFMAAKLF